MKANTLSPVINYPLMIDATTENNKSLVAQKAYEIIRLLDGFSQQQSKQVLRLTEDILQDLPIKIQDTSQSDFSE